MNIIIFSKNYENYTSGYYHQDFINSFTAVGNCYVYGEGYHNYNPSDNFSDVVAKSPFSNSEIDLVVVGTSWEEQNPNLEHSDPHPKINLKFVKAKKIFFLNKEYKKLAAKLEYAIENKFDLVVTVHHDYNTWAKKTGLEFMRSHFAVDPKRFQFQGITKKYDFGFTGSLHRDYTDIRYVVKSKIFWNLNALTNVGFQATLSNPIKQDFRKYNIYWAEWGATSFRRSLLPSGKKYVRFLNKFKTFMSTPSAVGIIGTRFFECMITKTIIMCPSSGD